MHSIVPHSTPSVHHGPSPISEPASASVTAITVLENPRSVSGLPYSVTFDAHLYLAPGREAIGALRLFNANHIQFETVGMYFVYANIAKFEPQAFPETVSTVLDVDDYEFIGDIQWIHPLPQNCDPQLPPYIHIVSTATDIHTGEHIDTFKLNPRQKTKMLESGTFPVQVSIEESPRWGNRRPTPAAGTTVYVTGFLTGMVRDLTPSPAASISLSAQTNLGAVVGEPKKPQMCPPIAYFTMNLDRVIYCGHPHPPAHMGIPSSVGSGITRGRSQKLQFNYGNHAIPATTPVTSDTPNDSNLAAVDDSHIPVKHANSDDNNIVPETSDAQTSSEPVPKRSRRTRS